MSEVAVAQPRSQMPGASKPRPWWGPYLQVVVVMGLLTLVPHLGLSNRHVHLAVICLIWSMAAYGLFVPYAFAGQLTIAVVTAWGVGAFATALSISYWNWSFLPSLGLAIVCGFVSAGIMALPILRTKGHYFMIITFVIAAAVTVAANNWSVTLGPAGGGLSIRKRITLLGWDFGGRVSMFYLCLGVVTVMALGAVYIRGSFMGKQWAAVRENEELARAIGVGTTWHKILALAVGGIFAGIAGSFYAYYMAHIDINNFGVGQAITLILMVVIGGRHAILGPLVGAAIVYYLPELISLDPNTVLIVYGLALGVVILLLPEGVIGGVDSLVRAVRRGRRQPEGETLAGEAA